MLGPSGLGLTSRLRLAEARPFGPRRRSAFGFTYFGPSCLNFLYYIKIKIRSRYQYIGNRCSDPKKSARFGFPAWKTLLDLFSCISILKWPIIKIDPKNSKILIIKLIFVGKVYFDVENRRFSTESAVGIVKIYGGSDSVKKFQKIWSGHTRNPEKPENR